MKRFLVVSVVALFLASTGCTSTQLTTQQVQDIAYMSGYASMAGYLIAKKPPVEQVEKFSLALGMVQSALTSSTSTATTQDILALVDSFVSEIPTDPKTQALLKALLPPMLIEAKTSIDIYISTQPESDQIRTIKLAAYATIEGIESACAAYIVVETNPPPVTPSPTPDPTSGSSTSTST